MIVSSLYKACKKVVNEFNEYIFASCLELEKLTLSSD